MTFDPTRKSGGSGFSVWGQRSYVELLRGGGRDWGRGILYLSLISHAPSIRRDTETRSTSESHRCSFWPCVCAERAK